MTTAPAAIRITRRFMSGAQRAVERDAVQARFETAASRLAFGLHTGTLDVALWQDRMSSLLSDHLIRQALLGSASGRLPSVRVAALQGELAKQHAHLSRFADTVAGKAATGAPMSEAAIARRAQSYAGAGRAAWFTSAVAEAKRVVYRAVDDGGTCGPCLAAEGEYAVDDPALPLPGQVCLGRSNCRCKLEIVQGA